LATFCYTRIESLKKGAILVVKGIKKGRIASALLQITDLERGALCHDLFPSLRKLFKLYKKGQNCQFLRAKKGEPYDFQGPRYNISVTGLETGYFMLFKSPSSSGLSN